MLALGLVVLGIGVLPSPCSSISHHPVLLPCPAAMPLLTQTCLGPDFRPVRNSMPAIVTLWSQLNSSVWSQLIEAINERLMVLYLVTNSRMKFMVLRRGC